MTTRTRMKEILPETKTEYNKIDWILEMKEREEIRRKEEIERELKRKEEEREREEKRKEKEREQNEKKEKSDQKKKDEEKAKKMQEKQKVIGKETADNKNKEKRQENPIESIPKLQKAVNQIKNGLKSTFKLRTKESSGITFNGEKLEHYKPTEKLKNQMNSKLREIKKFQIEASKYHRNRKSIGECKVYKSMKIYERKIQNISNILKKADTIEKKTAEEINSKFDIKEKKRLMLQSAEKITQIENILQNKLEALEESDLQNFTNLLQEKNKRMKYKSILANRSFNSNYEETNIKGIKLHKKILGKKKIEQNTLPHFSSKKQFDPDKRIMPEYPRMKSKISAEEYYLMWANDERKPGDKPHYTGVTRPLLGSKIEDTKKVQKQLPTTEFIDLDDTMESIVDDDDTDIYKGKKHPFASEDYRYLPSTLKQIIQSKTLEDNEERFEILRTRIDGPMSYLRFLRAPEHAFRNFKIKQ